MFCQLLLIPGNYGASKNAYCTRMAIESITPVRVVRFSYVSLGLFKTLYQWKGF